MPGQDNTLIPSGQPSDTITLWYGRCELETFDYPHFWQMLDAEEQAHAQNITHKRLHYQYVYIHGQLRQLLATTLQQTPRAIVIHKGTHGKPYLPYCPQLAFNLSHTGNIFVIALGWNCQLGVDIESPKPRPNFSGLVNKCFAPEEAQYWQQLPDALKTAEFYRYWTRKEAFVKATGFGIALGLQHCVINPSQPDSFLRVPANCGDFASWHLRDFELPMIDSQIFYGALSVDSKIKGVCLIELPTTP